MSIVEIQHGSAGVVFDPEEFRISMLELPSGRIRESFAFRHPFQSHYAGHEIVCAPNGGVAALFLYSDKNEHGWELFSLRPKLARLKGLPRAFGISDPPVFSRDSKYLVTTGTREIRWVDEGGVKLVEWAELIVQNLADGETKHYGLRVPASLDHDAPERWPQPNELVFESPDRLRMTLPWDATATIAIPPAGAVTLERQ